MPTASTPVVWKSGNDARGEGCQCYYLHAAAVIFRDLQVQPLFAGIQAVDHLLVCQFPRADRQASQITTEKLGHVQVSTFGTWGGKGRQLRVQPRASGFVSQGGVTGGGSSMDGHAG